MKFEYTEAKLELVEFDIEDIVTASVPEKDDEDDNVKPGGTYPSDDGYSGYH